MIYAEKFVMVTTDEASTAVLVCRLAVDMDIHGYIHGYIHVWISDLDRAVDISMDINARSLTFFLL